MLDQAQRVLPDIFCFSVSVNKYGNISGNIVFPLCIMRCIPYFPEKETNPLRIAKFVVQYRS